LARAVPGDQEETHVSRSRIIKPGFFVNDELTELPFEVRLLFIGLWTIADREGRFADRPKKIKLEIFPADDVDCDKCMSMLESRGFLTRYEIAGARFVQITNWNLHQKPHIKEVRSTIPEILAQEIPVQAPEKSVQAPESPVLAPESPERAALVLALATSYSLPALAQKQKQPPAAQAALRAQAKMPELPDWIDAEAWGGFVAMRQRERHPLTARAAKLVIAELAKLRAAGADPTAVLDQSTRNGWRDVYPIKTNGSGPPRAQSAQPSVAADFRQTRYEGTPDDKLPASLRI
jgi:hypothetical protein